MTSPSESIAPTQGPVTFDTGKQYRFKAVVITPADVTATPEQLTAIDALVEAEVTALEKDAGIRVKFDPPRRDITWHVDTTEAGMQQRAKEDRACRDEKRDAQLRNVPGADAITCPENFNRSILDEVERAGAWEKRQGEPPETLMYGYYLGTWNGSNSGASIVGRVGYTAVDPVDLEDDVFTEDELLEGSATSTGTHERGHMLDFRPGAEAAHEDPLHSSAASRDVLMAGGAKGSRMPVHVDKDNGYRAQLNRSPYFEFAPVDVEEAMNDAGRKAAQRGVALGKLTRPSEVTAGGWIRSYQNGVVAWSRDNGAHVVEGAIHREWLQRPDLGLPIEDAGKTSRSEGRGVAQRFVGGEIFAPTTPSQTRPGPVATR